MWDVVRLARPVPSGADLQVATMHGPDKFWCKANAWSCQVSSAHMRHSAGGFLVLPGGLAFKGKP